MCFDQPDPKVGTDRQIRIIEIIAGVVQTGTWRIASSIADKQKTSRLDTKHFAKIFRSHKRREIQNKLLCSDSLLGKARESALLDLRLHDPRAHTTDVHRTVETVSRSA